MKKKLALLGVMSALTMAVTMQPAGAFAGGAVGISGSPGHQLVVNAKVTGVLTGTSTMQVILECEAHAIGPAASTAINSCTATSSAGGSATAPSLALPGNFAATAGTNNVQIGRLTVCVRGTATWLDSTTSTSAQGCGTTVI